MRGYNFSIVYSEINNLFNENNRHYKTLDNNSLGGFNIFIIDTQMGVSGDMLLSAVIDLDMIAQKDFIDTLESIGNVWNKTKIQIFDDNYYGIKGKKLVFKYQFKPTKKGLPATKLIKYFNQAIDETGISKNNKLAHNILNTLLNAEAKVHNCSIDKLHLHETGSPDTIIDILGFVYFYEVKKLAKDKIYSTPISIGQGIWKTSHGLYSVPPPAALEILKDMQFKYGPVDGELATPTGLAILKNLIFEYVDYIQDVPITPKLVGYGLGTRVFEDYINILRIIYG
jgi:uncharacterized protein (DUF111 family)